MSKRMRSCRLCGGRRFDLFLHLPNAPANISQLVDASSLNAVPAVDLRAYRCRQCGMVQIPLLLRDDFYNEYFMTPSHSPQMQEYQRNQAGDFVRTYALSEKRVLEVGCGDGSFLRHLAAVGARVTGLEPSSTFRTEATKTGFPIHAGYVRIGDTVPGAPYAAVVTRQVLEHIEDIHGFLQGLRENLEPGAAGLIEVPSLEQAMEHNRFFDFFPDHVNYFSQRTLRLALELNGFCVDSMMRGMNGEYNVAFVHPDDAHGARELQQQTSVVIQELREFVRRETEQNRRVAVWGAGGKGLTALAVAQVDGIAYVIDSDSHKIGRFTPVSHLPIYAPDRLRADPVDSVILTALAYRREINEQLRTVYGFRGKVVTLGVHLEVEDRV